MPSNATRIAKNTLMLYLRQIIIMLVSLFTVRVVLNTLGTEDYGIYNVIAGVVVMFSFLNSAMTQATQRFMNFAMGQDDIEQLKNVYSTSLIIHIFVAIFVIILAETIGLWFFFTLLNIPSNRQTAAFIVYQFSVITTTFHILQVPYHATIIAYEKMSFFSLLSVIEALLKVGIVFLLVVIMYDKLIIYAILVSLVSLVILLIYKIYCNRAFEIANFCYNKDNKIFRQIARFSGWSIFGAIANLCRNHGINILVNIFYGVTVNAAMGIAMQVNTAVYAFVTNFQTAFRPQIVKSYAAKEYDYFMKLIFQTSKISFFLLLFFVLPLYFNADFVLKIWLKNVPEYSIIFVRIILLYSLFDAIAGPLWMSIQATGDIKKYQLIVSCFVFANLPLSLLFLWLGFSPICVLTIKLGLNVITFIWRIYFLNKMIKFPIMVFLFEVIIPIFIIVVISSFFTGFINYFFIEWKKLIVSCFISTVIISCLVYFIGLNVQEKDLLREKIIKFFTKKRSL